MKDLQDVVVLILWKKSNFYANAYIESPYYYSLRPKIEIFLAHVKSNSFNFDY